jgi:glycosyltransferase involved in cell wall biosynthesis
MDLATELHSLGHAVRVLTLTPADEPDAFPFEVVRGTGFGNTVRFIRQCDVFVQFNISLKGIVPWLLTGRPLVATHHSLYPRNILTGRLKWAVTRLAAVNTGCSLFISQQYYRGQLLPNPYNETVFQHKEDANRQNRLIFLGRLVSEKGCDLLLRALEQLKRTYSLTPMLTVIGDGPERRPLERLSNELGVASQVTFRGSQTGTALADTLKQHTVLVVPSVYEEPFGIVALEGIACGCFVVGSRAGGLPEAIGPCGITFPMGNAVALAHQLFRGLTDSKWRKSYCQYASVHLQQHTRQRVAQRFIEIITERIYG